SSRRLLGRGGGEDIGLGGRAEIDPQEAQQPGGEDGKEHDGRDEPQERERRGAQRRAATAGPHGRQNGSPTARCTRNRLRNPGRGGAKSSATRTSVPVSGSVRKSGAEIGA